MPGWQNPEHPPCREPYDPPPPPPHVVDDERFPAPSANELAAALASKDLGYLAHLALRRGRPEFRVLAALLVRLWRTRRDDPTQPPGQGPSPTAG
jgi:hypothetical protein